jgi:hypothetical protein
MRHVLLRSVYPKNVSERRRRKRVRRVEELWIDGFNVLITVEAILSDETLILCDDDVLRDVRGVFGKYKWNERSEMAVELIKSKLQEISKNSIILLDSQVSKSGEIAKKIGELTEIKTMTSKSVDRELKSKRFVATSDGTVIDAVEGFVDIPRILCEELGITVYSTSIANFLTMKKERV